MLADAADHSFDLFLEVETGRVEDDGVRRLPQWRDRALPIQAIAGHEAIDLGAELVLGGLGHAVLGETSPCSGGGVRGQEDLHVRVREDDGPHVPAIAHQVDAGSRVPEVVQEPVPDGGNSGHAGDVGIDLRGSELAGDVVAMAEESEPAIRRLGGYPETLELGVIQRCPLLRRDAGLESGEGEGPIERAGVQVPEGEAASDLASGGALPGAGGSVDGDDHRVSFTEPGP